MYEIGSVLSVRKDFYRHVGVYVGDGMVFHNHPESGQAVVSVEHFARGRKVKVKKSGLPDHQAFKQRLTLARQRPSSYNVFLRNCEHTASALRSGSASSPQLWLYSGIGVLTVAAGLLLGRSARR